MLASQNNPGGFGGMPGMGGPPGMGMGPPGMGGQGF